MIKEMLREYVESATGRSDVTIDAPPNPEMGDYSTAVAFQIAKEERKNPVEIAKNLVEKFSSEMPAHVEKIIMTGPYINFFIDMHSFSKSVLCEIDEKKDAFGHLERNRQQAIIEHTSVNPNKPLHMGAARNSILGDCVARAMAAGGYDVEVENYIDDLGIQFAEVFWGILKYGDNPQEKYDHFLGKLYIKVHQEITEDDKNDIKKLNKEMEDPSSPLSSQSRHVVEKCVKSQIESLAKLGIRYDLLVWESDIVHAGLFDETFERLRKSDDIVEEVDGPLEGCLVMKLGRVFPDMKNPDKVLIRSDGTPTYTAKDIALQMWKFGILEKKLKYAKWDESGTMTSTQSGTEMEFGNATNVINVIGSEQSYPQEVVKLSLKLIGYEKESENSFHLAYEFVTLPDDKFSGRSGTWMGFTLDEVIEAGEKKAYEEVARRKPELSEDEKTAIAKEIGRGSIRYNIIKYAPEKKIVFRWDDALNFDGDSCPYLQYAHARCCSILKKVEDEQTPDYAFDHPKEKELIKALSEMSDVIRSTCREKRPHYITKYVNDVAMKFNSFYNELPVLKSERRADRIALVRATRQVISNCLVLLGITPLEEM